MSLLRLLLLAAPLVSAHVGDGTVLWGITKNAGAQEAQLKRRSMELQGRADTSSSTVSATLANSVLEGLYSANISIGTPAQSVTVQIDTGSSDLWVPSASATYCTASKKNCNGGTFDRTKSTTFADIGAGEFNISYVDGTGSAGDYFQDTMTIGGATVKNLEMGLALSTTIGTGIMGIGYNSSEANIGSGNGTTYANLPFAMVDQGIIKTEAYSLWLNDLNSASGSILFGGVDTAKYTGDLISVPVYPAYRGRAPTTFTVAFTSLSATSSSGTDILTPSNYAEGAILDSGTTITLLPNDIAQVVYNEFGATYQPSIGAVVVPCSLANANGSLNFGFGGADGPVIQVPVNELVLPLTLTNGKTLTYTNGEKACQLAIQAAGALPVLFGDSFLRSAYAVYDLVNNRIALAQTDFNATGSNIVPFASSGAPIPSATSATEQLAAVTQTATGIPKVVASATITGAGGATATYNPTATGLSAASGFSSASPTGTTSSTKKSAGERVGGAVWQVWAAAGGLWLGGVMLVYS